MANVSSDNRRIAKNTVLLYLRMFIILGVSLYTSRVVLAVLGITDYGVYNVVGGVVSMFTFISMAMGNATARYITFALGRGDELYLKKVFNTALLVHIGIAILILILAETVGLWFLINKMVIPADRMVAAHWVYQLSVVAAMVSIVYVPYNSEIIAHEKMGAFAYISILDVILKLAIVYILTIAPYDKLILYAVLFLGVNLLDTLIYYLYCRRHFSETKLMVVKDWPLIKEMTSFAGWSMIGNLAGVGYTQGLNILLNIYFGPVVNAARGVAVQVQGAVKGFVTNFQTAVNPQLIKSYAQEDYSRMHTLLFSSSKLSFYLLFCIVLPIIIQAQPILSLWLVEVPEHTVSFMRLILIITLIDTIERPVNTSINATGDLKLYQTVSCSIQLLVLPVSYIFLRLGSNPETVFGVQFFILLAAFIAELLILIPRIKLYLVVYIKEVVLSVLVVASISSIVSVGVSLLLPDTLTGTIIIISFSILIVWVVAYFVGMNCRERELVRTYLSNFISKICFK